ncbi:MAG: GDP-mannose 4,6-dehydratase [Anaerolineales bacterium]|nr:GDP-mannose 4,6-dehydratase [Anaerolineales bacterium]
MKALITGATGFVGHYLADELSSTYETIGAYWPEATTNSHQKFAALHKLDIRDEAAVRDLVATVQPDVIFHLAAQTHVPTAFKAPWDTLETNIQGTLNFLQATLDIVPNSRILVISSSEVYGVVQAGDLPLVESQSYNPGNPYSVSKVTGELLSRQYFMAYGLDVIIARPFNHIGPGQSTRFAVADFATQIAGMQRGEHEPILRVGNLSAQRDYLDVRDVVRAYRLLAEKGIAGEVYNICRGEAHPLQSLVETLIDLAGIPVQIEVEASRLRPLDLPILVGDPTKIKTQTGWQAEIPVEQTLRDVLAACQ